MKQTEKRNFKSKISSQESNTRWHSSPKAHRESFFLQSTDFKFRIKTNIPKATAFIVFFFLFFFWSLFEIFSAALSYFANVIKFVNQQHFIAFPIYSVEKCSTISYETIASLLLLRPSAHNESEGVNHFHFVYMKNKMNSAFGMAIFSRPSMVAISQVFVFNNNCEHFYTFKMKISNKEKKQDFVSIFEWNSMHNFNSIGSHFRNQFAQ